MLNELFSPSKEYSPIPFWFFNDAYDHDKTVKQFTDFVEKGVNGFVLHPRIGIPQSMGYLSDAFFAAVKDIVAIAHDLDMTVILYDEGMYPSGSACGQVVAENPAYKAKGLKLVSKDEVEKAQRLAESSKKASQPLDIIADLDGGEGRFLVYTETGGNIRGIHFGEDDGEPFAPPATDLLNPDAVECFIRLTHDKYYQELSAYFGNTIIAMFTDEPSPVGRNAGDAKPWYPGLEKDLVAQGGSVRDLAELFDGKDWTNLSIGIYHRLIKERLNKVFYGPLAKWCHEHGIGLCGHPDASDDVREEFLFDIPGQDLIMRRVCPENKGLFGLDSVQAKLCADIAFLIGKRRNLNECFGVCSLPSDPYQLPEEDMVWMINWLGFRGTNLYVPHAFYYTYTSKQREDRPPDVGPNALFWSRYRQYTDYMKRISFLNTDSRIDTKIAVLCDNNLVPADEIADLYEYQVPFVYVPVELAEKLLDFEFVVDPLGIWEKSKAVSIMSDAVQFTTVSALVSGRQKHEGLRFVQRIKDEQKFALLSNEGSEEWNLTLPELGKVTRTNGADFICQTAYNLFTMEKVDITTRISIKPGQMLVLV